MTRLWTGGSYSAEASLHVDDAGNHVIYGRDYRDSVKIRLAEYELEELASSLTAIVEPVRCDQRDALARLRDALELYDDVHSDREHPDITFELARAARKVLETRGLL